tara:strand:- start:17 stop:271 length:255 start_codon:yes stop_codon:yes gene_type:complete
MTAEQVEKYIREDLGMTPRHDCHALAEAINQTQQDMDHPDEWDLFHLLIENKPIPSLYTHSYGFHTANGRGIIERIKSYYYEQI